MTRPTRPRPDGYIDVRKPSHPLARKDGYLFQHRYVAWEAGLLTDPTLQVHHIDGDKTNNDLSNLEVKSCAQHTLEHQESLKAVTNQYGTFPVKPKQDRASYRYPSAGALPRPPQTCKGCDDTFQGKRSDARYCSNNCRMRHWKRSRQIGLR